MNVFKFVERKKAHPKLRKSLSVVLTYIIFIGACGLLILSVIPFVFNGVLGAVVSFGGTSLIIIVSVVLETVKQIESLLLVRNYKGFLND